MISQETLKRKINTHIYMSDNNDVIVLITKKIVKGRFFRGILTRLTYILVMFITRSTRINTF